MQLLFNIEVLSNAKPSDKFKLKCKFCHKVFKITKKRIQDCLNPKKLDKGDYCSHVCAMQSRLLTRQNYFCANCKNTILCLKSQKKSTNKFCSHSCSATYNNINKKSGHRRSKLEVFVEKNIKLKMPWLEILFNDKQAIGSELDIFVPRLKKAVEINGILHFKPIFGPKKLSQIQNNDNKKILRCKDKEIQLLVIDVSNFKRFNETEAGLILQEIITFVS